MSDIPQVPTRYSEGNGADPIERLMEPMGPLPVQTRATIRALIGDGHAFHHLSQRTRAGLIHDLIDGIRKEARR